MPDQTIRCGESPRLVNARTVAEVEEWLQARDRYESATGKPYPVQLAAVTGVAMDYLKAIMQGRLEGEAMGQADDQPVVSDDPPPACDVPIYLGDTENLMPNETTVTVTGNQRGALRALIDNGPLTGPALNAKSKVYPAAKALKSLVKQRPALGEFIGFPGGKRGGTYSTRIRRK